MRVVSEKSKYVQHDENSAGIVIHKFLASFDDTFNQSSHLHFQSFFNRNSHVSKWMIFSDYALNDKDKTNDAITFSIIPYTQDFFERADEIQKHSFKDVKKLKRVNHSFINYINDNEILNISIVFSKDIKLDPLNEREALKTSRKIAINQVNYWIKNEGEKEHYKYLLKVYNSLLDELSKPGVNLRNIRNIEIVSNLAAYILFQVCMCTQIDVIGWFSDRDAMLTHKAGRFNKPIIFDLTKNLFHNLMFSSNEEYSEKLVFGLPETSGKVWYDSYNRIPDLIAATLADYDYINNKCSHDKFIPIVENILTNNEKTIIYRVILEENNFSASLLSLSRL